MDFVVAGTQKGGTTSLVAYLREHPELCMPLGRKELHYFDTDKYFQSKPVDYAAYHSRFMPTAEQHVLGEATPIYMYWEPVPCRLRQYNPAMKVIVVLRNPVTRAYSHWNHERLAGREPLPFHAALREEPARAQRVAPRQLRRHSYIDRGFYTRQLARIWRHFPVGQTLILRTDDLLASPAATLARIAEFLRIGPFPAVDAKRLHARPYERAIHASEKDYLQCLFEAEITELERILGWDCADWR